MKMLTLICIRSILPVIIPVPRRRPRRPPSHYPYLPSTRRAWCDACVTCLHWPQDRSPCAGHAQQLVLQAVDRKIFRVLEQLQEYCTSIPSFPATDPSPAIRPSALDTWPRARFASAHTLVFQSGYVLALCCTASIDCRASARTVVEAGAALEDAAEAAAAEEEEEA